MGSKARAGLGLALLLLAAPAVGPAEEIDNDTCLSCHSDPAGVRFVDPQQFDASVHAPLNCTSCHTDATTVPHALPLRATQWQQVPAMCGQCHGDVQQAFEASIHGQAVVRGRREAPVCTDCHGVHTIAPVKTSASTVFASRVPETCGQCHAAERLVTRYRLPGNAVSTYMESFHGLAAQLGSVTAANCASCHGAHQILPSVDPASSIHPAKLPHTCGACHAGMTTQVAQGRIHALPPRESPGAVGWVRRFYLALIALVLGGMLLHNAVDFWAKLRAHYRLRARQGRPRRMSPAVVWQHAVLLVAFVTLAYTGFALKFPHTWWASPFTGHGDWRRFGHRAAAALFVGLSVFHLWYLLCTRRGREELRALCPRRIDLVQPFQLLAHRLGRRAARPVFAKYSYIEKLEYWALVWGSMIMATTGALMTWQNWTLGMFPKWFFDVVAAIHYYEAILACLAIVIWHGYFVMFDPDEYPMKWTWVTWHASPTDETHRQE